MTHPSVPYVPGPMSTPPVSPPVVDHQAQPAASSPVVVGATVDLAHELAQLRKLQTTTLVIAGTAMLFALFAMVFAGYVAFYVYRFIDALQKAFG